MAAYQFKVVKSKFHLNMGVRLPSQVFAVVALTSAALIPAVFGPASGRQVVKVRLATSRARPYLWVLNTNACSLSVALLLLSLNSFWHRRHLHKSVTHNSASRGKVSLLPTQKSLFVVEEAPVRMIWSAPIVQE